MADGLIYFLLPQYYKNLGPGTSIQFWLSSDLFFFLAFFFQIGHLDVLNSDYGKLTLL